jgi:DNA-binding SARP family transcriptional activator/tetratricopeptide (TPR) repeat protein
VGRFGVLGPLRVTDTSGEWLRLRGDRQRNLLAMLLFHANREVPADRLVGALWDGTPPRSYASNLHTYVSRLRERVGPVEHVGNGYRLRVEESELDLLVFLTEAELGRRAARAGDHVAAAAHLRAALAQWRDHPLADLHLPVLGSEIARLETERLAVFEDCMEAELAAGRHTEVLGELRAAVAEHPLSERLAGQLMVALRRSGRQADALAVYRSTRATLIEETGIEPGAELRRVQAEILHGSVEPAFPICQLPADIADFSGRRAETAELADLLRHTPLVVLSGEPGVGKSTLAVRVAHLLRAEFPGGQLFAHLAGASSPRAAGDVLTDLLGALGVSGPEVPDDLSARAAMFRGRLADRRVLIVLDDAADPAQVRPLLPGTASCAVIVTSRRRLSGLAGAHRVPLPPLRDADARLLLERIVGARVAGEPSVTARIVAACGNLPLALRIAGTRLALRPQLRLGALADRLEDERLRLDELTVSDLEVRSSLALSYRGLTEPARATLRLIGIADLSNLPTWAITVLTGPGADGAIEELIESSLLQPAGEDASGEPRYRLHDIVRAFARELALEQDGLADRERASERLAHTALALADRAARRLPRTVPLPMFDDDPTMAWITPDEVARLVADPEGWFDVERPSIVAGIVLMCRTGQHATAMRIFERFARFLWLQGHYVDLRTCAESLVAVGDERVAPRAEAVLALLLHVRGRYAEAADAYRRCVDRLSATGDRPALAWVLNNLANCLIGLGEPADALATADRAGTLFDADFGLLSVLRTRATALQRLGRAEEAVRADTEGLAVARRSGEPLLVAQALHGLSWSLALTGELDRAADLATEAITLLRPTTARSALARSLRTLGAITAGLGDRVASVAAFHEAREIALAVNERPRALSCTRAIAASRIADGHPEAAIPDLRDCLAAYREMGSTSAATITLRLLAAAYTAAGDTAAARESTEEADRLDDPRDANARTLLCLLLNLTRRP